MAANKSETASESDIEGWDEHLETLIDLFKPVLLDTLRVSHLLCLIHIQEVKDKAGVIHQKENDGDFQEAAKTLLDAIKISDQPGKWQMFIDALIEKEDTAILRTLLSERSHIDDPWLSDQANRKLIQIFGDSIREGLQLDHLLNEMLSQGLILKEDIEQLRSLIRSGKRRQANVVLLLLMHRHSSDWYNIFMGILCDDDHHSDLANRIDPEYCNKRKGNAEKREDGASHSLNSSQGGQPTAQSLSEASSTGHIKDAPSIGRNLRGQTSAQEKVVGDKPLPRSGYDHGKGDELSPHISEMMVNCQCQCCATLLTKVSSLESEMDEVKALLKFLVNQKKSEFVRDKGKN